MSQSEHSMITRSKQKLIELDHPTQPSDNDEMDDQGNLKGFIDYECDEEFDNDMFQKELKRLRGGNRSPQTILNLSPSKKRKKVKRGKNKLPDMLASYMIMNLLNTLGDKKGKKKYNKKRDNISINIIDEEDLELSESEEELISDEEDDENDEDIEFTTDEEEEGEEEEDEDEDEIDFIADEIEMDEYD